MPIKPENRHLYPRNWRELRDSIVARDKNRCRFCDLPNYTYVLRRPGKDKPLIVGPAASFGDALQRLESEHGQGAYDGPGKLVKIILTVAHLNHDPTDNRDINLAALCQKCHNQWDQRHHKGNAARTRDRKAGQLRFEDAEA